MPCRRRVGRVCASREGPVGARPLCILPNVAPCAAGRKAISLVEPDGSARYSTIEPASVILAGNQGGTTVLSSLRGDGAFFIGEYVVRLGFYELKKWFWLRTYFWALIAIVVTGTAVFFASTEQMEDPGTRLLISFMVGLVTVASNLLVVNMSTNTPWMRSGFLWSFLPNGFVCALGNGFVTAVLCVGVLSFMSIDPENLPTEEDLATAWWFFYLSMGSGVFWGFIFGNWFAMRRDKYFVEDI